VRLVAILKRLSRCWTKSTWKTKLVHLHVAAEPRLQEMQLLDHIRSEDCSIESLIDDTPNWCGDIRMLK
jgi:hypothetical protein